MLLSRLSIRHVSASKLSYPEAPARSTSSRWLVVFARSERLQAHTAGACTSTWCTRPSLLVGIWVLLAIGRLVGWCVAPGPVSFCWREGRRRSRTKDLRVVGGSW